MVSIRLLGELQVWDGDTAVTLPPSRKTRLLLAYLAATARPQLTSRHGFQR
jgi:DNA-binding SARP family transcriptional activator